MVKVRAQKIPKTVSRLVKKRHTRSKARRRLRKTEKTKSLLNRSRRTCEPRIGLWTRTMA